MANSLTVDIFHVDQDANRIELVDQVPSDNRDVAGVLRSYVESRTRASASVKKVGRVYVCGQFRAATQMKGA